MQEEETHGGAASCTRHGPLHPICSNTSSAVLYLLQKERSKTEQYNKASANNICDPVSL